MTDAKEEEGREPSEVTEAVPAVTVAEAEASDHKEPEAEDKAAESAVSAPSEEPVTFAQVAKENRQEEAKEETYVPRQIALTLSRVEPWSVMKMAFLLSVCLGAAMIVAAFIVWLILNMMHVFSSLQEFVKSIDSSGMVAGLVELVTLPRAMALSTVIAVCNVALLTALATVAALLYNRVAALVGGVHVTFQDE
ncbi:MAG: DUF3566 domain-containing protein [Actinomycetaceae bacterium]|nr:DUF3566 domain-containing protein [Actinomycetaceae bacterium]